MVICIISYHKCNINVWILVQYLLQGFVRACLSFFREEEGAKNIVTDMYGYIRKNFMDSDATVALFIEIK